jgi:hypothetical protein
MRVQCFGPEETIIREGEKGERFYIINDGEVAVFKNNGGNEVGGGGRSRGVNALPLKKKKKNPTNLSYPTHPLSQLSACALATAVACALMRWRAL